MNRRVSWRVVEVNGDACAAYLNAAHECLSVQLVEVLTRILSCKMKGIRPEIVLGGTKYVPALSCIRSSDTLPMCQKYNMLAAAVSILVRNSNVSSMQTVPNNCGI